MFPINHRIKYPIYFENLIERINILKFRYNYSCLNEIIVYDNKNSNQIDFRKKINNELKNKGGIYLWWCKPTGLFYIGSAKSFVGKNGRLNDYFQKNRLLKITNSKISLSIGKDMLIYPKPDWNLIILESLDSSNLTDLTILRQKEQFWMLLIPTYNRSLVVGSNDGLPMSNNKRKSLSTIIYIYEISNEGQLIPNSEQKVYGIKELSRTGIKSKFSDDYTEANLWDIQAYISSGLPFKNKFVLTKNPFTFEEQLNWKYLNKSTSLHPSPKGEGPPFGEGDKNEENLKLKGVWVYDYNSLNFIEYFNSVKSCQDKYQIPSTTFKRIRKHKLNFKGYLFSNCDLNITKTPDT